MFNQSILISSGVGTLALALLLGCTSLQPVAPSTRLGDRPATEVVLSLPSSCVTSPDRTPMGRPDGEQDHEHRLPAGRYVPRFEDGRGVFFESPSGITITQALPVGSRVRPGGIYVPHDHELAALEYLGDEDRVTERSRLPERCAYTLEGSRSPEAVN
jgi:hypothetical protein